VREGENWLIFAIFAFPYINHMIIFAKFAPEQIQKTTK
jgi:hypothetical protein